MGRSVEFIRLHASHGFYQNHICMMLSQGEGLTTIPFYFLLLVEREGREERSESYLAS